MNEGVRKVQGCELVGLGLQKVQQEARSGQRCEHCGRGGSRERIVNRLDAFEQYKTGDSDRLDALHKQQPSACRD